MTKTIKQLCEEYGISQTELSRMYGIPLRTVQDWHAGRRTPPPYVVKMLDELMEKPEPLFRFNIGDVVYDRSKDRPGEIFSRCQNRYGLITYELKGAPPVEFWWAPQKYLEPGKF